ncbi:MAG: cupin domain-containing protein [Gaiellales bacterium]
MSEPFSPLIRSFPQVENPVVPLNGWLLHGPEAVAMFYELPDGADLPEHVHGAQWGVVLAGQVDFTIGGETTTFRPGDTYAIEPGVPHSAHMYPGTVGIDVFGDPHPYRRA